MQQVDELVILAHGLQETRIPVVWLSGAFAVLVVVEATVLCVMLVHELGKQLSPPSYSSLVATDHALVPAFPGCILEFIDHPSIGGEHIARGHKPCTLVSLEDRLHSVLLVAC